MAKEEQLQARSIESGLLQFLLRQYGSEIAAMSGGPFVKGP